jgi:hypothetical protein
MVTQQETIVNSRGERKTNTDRFSFLSAHKFCKSLHSAACWVLNIDFLWFIWHAVLIDTEYEPLIPREEKSKMVNKFHLHIIFVQLPPSNLTVSESTLS